MTRLILIASCVLIAAVTPIAGQEILDGTWKLVSSKRTTTTTGTTIDTFGSDPQGYIMYGKDGRMMVLLARVAIDPSQRALTKLRTSSATGFSHR